VFTLQRAHFSSLKAEHPHDISLFVNYSGYEKSNLKLEIPNKFQFLKAQSFHHYENERTKIEIWILKIPHLIF